jgi:hypothetical protein
VHVKDEVQGIKEVKEVVPPQTIGGEVWAACAEGCVNGQVSNLSGRDMSCIAGIHRPNVSGDGEGFKGRHFTTTLHSISFWLLVTLNVNGLQVLRGQFGGRTGREPAETS